MIKPVIGEVYFVLPRGTLVQIHKCGPIDFAATNNHGETEVFIDTLVFLCEDPNWTEFLVGRPTLRRKLLLPEQNFGKLDRLKDIQYQQKVNSNNDTQNGN